ncbi:MAG: lamin tail domain-containing protein [Nanoarchaeota archaeon]|nr:lamin tail domain-containing protein [Nanoarchaeota archaeon]
MRKAISGLLLASFVYGSSAYDVKINEFVTDPKQDHNGSGTITDSDEYFELYNSSTNIYDLSGWTLNLRDLDNQGIERTSETIVLENLTLGPNSFQVIINPRGDQTNNGRLELYNGEELVDSVNYGSWPGSILPDGNATSLKDESLSRYPDGGTNWVKTYATRGKQNSLTRGLTLLIERTNSMIKVYSTNNLAKQTIIQRTENIGVWENIHTNSPGERLEFLDALKERGFYRTEEK